MAEGEKALEERIRHRAYELWEEAGRPHGQSEKYWQQPHAISDPPAMTRDFARLPAVRYAADMMLRAG